MPEENEDDFNDCHEIWADCSSKQLEGKGVDYMLQGPIKTLMDAGKVVRVCSDGDCEISSKLKKVNLTHFLVLSMDGNGIMMDH